MQFSILPHQGQWQLVYTADFGNGSAVSTVLAQCSSAAAADAALAHLLGHSAE